MNTLIRETVISENFVAIPVRDGFEFVTHGMALCGLIRIATAIRQTKRAHPCLTRCGVLHATDLTEARAILATLEGALQGDVDALGTIAKKYTNGVAESDPASYKAPSVGTRILQEGTDATFR